MNFEKIYQFKVSLLEIEPANWRRIQVPDCFTLKKLHDALQIVMGWQECHLHSFKVGRKEYGTPDPDYEDMDIEMLDEKKITLRQIVDQGTKEIGYEYDPDDSWRHLLVLERVLEPDDSVHYPICLEGERACPPEDVGGNPGFQTFLEALTDKKHPEHKSFKTWIGGHFNAASFDTNAVNRQLRHVRWFPKPKPQRNLKAVHPN